MNSFPSALAAFLLMAVLVPLASAADETLRTGDTVQGKKLFQQSCLICHATGQADQPQSGQGPSLAGIMGRPAASLTNFGYTKALANAKLTWDAATLDSFLAAPTTVAPGTAMVVAVPSPADRRDLVAFIATLPAVADNTAQPAATAHKRTAGDWQNDFPGTVHRVKLDELPVPYATSSAGNSPKTVARPADAIPAVPAGFQAKLFVSDLSGPRILRTAPNGDIFIAETGRGRIRILRAADGADAPSENSLFVENLTAPFGIAFYPLQGEPQWVYVANVNSVVRFPYRNGDLKARGPAEIIVPKLTDSSGGHSTRDIVFSLDGKRLYISVGSSSNVDEGMPEKTPEEIRQWEAATARGATWGIETNRADVLVCDPDGRNLKIFAAGIRNAVGVAVQPGTGKLWVSTNERDGLGDDLVPDYITHVQEGGFYGWPWYYLGKNEDPRHAGKRPDLANHVIVPDVPLHSHSATLELTFYPSDIKGASAFPADYHGDIFAALHGSWNRTGRTGSKVIRVRLKDGVATGDYEDFLTGFVIDDAQVWGRPVGVTVARDGALLVSEDANGTIWRVSTTPR